METATAVCEASQIKNLEKRKEQLGHGGISNAKKMDLSVNKCNYVPQFVQVCV